MKEDKIKRRLIKFEKRFNFATEPVRYNLIASFAIYPQNLIFILRTFRLFARSNSIFEFHFQIASFLFRRKFSPVPRFDSRPCSGFLEKTDVGQCDRNILAVHVTFTIGLGISSKVSKVLSRFSNDKNKRTLVVASHFTSFLYS